MVAWNSHIIILVCEKFTLMAISSVNNLIFKGQMELACSLLSFQFVIIESCSFHNWVFLLVITLLLTGSGIVHTDFLSSVVQVQLADLFESIRYDRQSLRDRQLLAPDGFQ